MHHTDNVYHTHSPHRASSFLGASQYARGERGKALGWEPRSVVLEDWAEEGLVAALGKQQQQ